MVAPSPACHTAPVELTREQAIARRLATLGVALACAAIGGGVGALFGVRGSKFVGLGGAWVSLALALALEPEPRGARWRTALAAALAASGGAAFSLWAATRDTPSWYTLDATAPTLGLLAACVAWVDSPVRPWLVLTVALLPGPALLLVVRRTRRQLEWPAAAAALALVMAALAVALGNMEHWSQVLALAVSGLPMAFGPYLLDRRRLGPAGLAAFPAPEPPPAEDGSSSEAGEPTPRAADPQPARPPRGVLALAALTALAASLLAGSVGPRLLTLRPEPGCPDMTAVLEDVRARQAAHVAREGAPPRVLGALRGVSPDVAGGYAQGHVLRYARLDDARWVITADPVPARLGWPSLRLVGPDGPVERGVSAFRLEAP